MFVNQNQMLSATVENISQTGKSTELFDCMGNIICYIVYDFINMNIFKQVFDGMTHQIIIRLPKINQIITLDIIWSLKVNWQYQGHHASF